MMVKDKGVFYEALFAEMTAEEVRKLDWDMSDELALALDNAQGKVFTGEEPVSYVVIKITGAKP